MLKGKHILLGVTGGIAAYKSATLIRLLVKQGADVRVIMTPAATEFITPLTLGTLSRNPVMSEFFDSDGSWNSHVDLGLWADIFILAPATANTIAKMAVGIADNLLVTTYMSARCPVILAPAMDLDMFRHPTTTTNISTLAKRGVEIIEPGSGELASGLEGKGRMAEPEDILEKTITCIKKKKSLTLKGKKVLVNAGPTYERIDPVRFIGNFSTGKMGIAIAEEAAKRGGEVTLVLGPTQLKPENASIKVVSVESAEEMSIECTRYFETADITILSAAVADFRPSDRSDKKIKRKDRSLTISLEPTSDIAGALGKMKRKDQLLVGFALETDNEMVNAEGKLKKKNLDLIVLNSLNDSGAGFATDTNRITLIDRSNNIDKFELKSKTGVAYDILNKIERLVD